MLDLRQLKAGNFLLAEKDTLVQVDGSMSPIVYGFIHYPDKKISRTAHPYHVNEVEGIPISEEWLFKFGFKKHNKLKMWYVIESDHLSKHSLGLEIHIVNGEVSVEDYDEDDTIILPYKIQFVHQIQNLYYFLSNKELVLNNQL